MKKILLLLFALIYSRSFADYSNIYGNKSNCNNAYSTLVQTLAWANATDCVTNPSCIGYGGLQGNMKTVSLLTNPDYSHMFRLIYYMTNQKSGRQHDVSYCDVSIEKPMLIENFNHLSLKDKNLQVACGSEINYDNKTLNESINLIGTPFTLVYSSQYNEYFQRTLNQEFFFSETNNNKLRFDTKINGLNIQKFDSNPISQYIKHKIVIPNSMLPLVTNNFLDSFQVSSDISRVMTFTNSAYCTTNSNGQENCFPSTESESTYSVNTYDKSLDVFKPSGFLLGEWTISLLHYFNRNTKKMYTGYGQIFEYEEFKTVSTPEYGLVDVIIEKNGGSELYLFDQNGKHLETRHSTQNYPVFKFFYTTDGRLNKVQDQYSNNTTFQYTNNKISKIISPKGIETLLSYDGENSLSQVVHANGLKHTAQYDQQKLLSKFSDIKGVVTNFTYNSSFELTEESKNTNQFQSFFENIIANFKEQIHRKNYGIENRFLVKLDTEKVTTEQVDSSENIIFSRSRTAKTPSIIKISSSGLSKDTAVDSNTIWKTSYEPVTNTRTVINESSTLIDQTEFTSESRSYGVPENPLSVKATTKQYRSTQASAISYAVMSVNTDSSSTWTLNGSDGSQYTKNFNIRGQLLNFKSNFGYPTSFSYYPDGTVQKIQKGSEWTSFSYNQYGYLANETTSKGHSTSYTTDIEGKILSKILPNGDQVSFEYTDGGEIKKITAPNGQVHQFQMSLGDFVTNVLTPTGKNTVFDYDSDKRVTQITKPSGKKIIYNYKTESPKIETISTPSGNIVFNDIDVRSRLKSVTSTDNIKTEIDWVHTIPQEQRFYDTDGSLIGKITYGFLPDQLKVNQIKINDQNVANYTFDYAGRIQSLNQATYSYYIYDYTQKIYTYFGSLSTTLSTEDTDSGDKPIQTLSAMIKDNPSLQLYLVMQRSFDTFGNAKEFSLSTRNTQTNVYNNFYTLTPTYDANSRLIQIAKNRKSYINGQQINSTDFFNDYNYPENSNNNVKEYSQALSPSSSPIKRTIASHSPDDQLTKLNGSINRDYEYTDDGDLKSMTNCFGKTSYEYDVFSNLKKVTLPNNTVIEYKVDGLNRRIKKLINGQTKEYYLWYDQTKVAAILDENKVPKLQYIYGPESSISPSYVIKNNITYKILHDPGLGSIRYIIEPTSQQIVQEIEYDEFGNMMRNTNPDFQPILFTGGLYDFDTKLYRFGARDYDPTIGRWTTKDPSGFRGGDANLYSYCYGNPMSCHDPTGRVGIFGAGFGLVAGGVGAYIASGGDISATALGAILGAGIGAVAPQASLSIGSLVGNAGLAAAANLTGQAVGNVARTGDLSLYSAFSNINVPTLLLSPAISMAGTGATAVGVAMGAPEVLVGGGVAIGNGYLDLQLSQMGNVNMSRACGLKPPNR